MNANNEYVWLNDLSLQFLERDYLLPGQSVDSRIKEIAFCAEKILKKIGFAEKFISYMKKGFFSLSSPIWTNFGTENRGLPISCVVGDTWINCRRGKKYARDICIGDEVLTHCGRYQQISNIIITRNRGGIHCLRIDGCELFITENHLVLTRDRGWVRCDQLQVGCDHIAYNEEICNPDPICQVFSRQVFHVLQHCEFQPNRREDVWDFTVDNDHSFCGGGICLHNCFGSHISDNMESILYTQSEVGMMTKMGGGTSAYFDLRPRGTAIKDNGESSGAVHFMQLFDSLITVVSQGRSRRGNMAAYLEIYHKDIMEFLSIRSEGHPIQDLSTGVCIPDYWMNEMIDGDQEKRKIWAKVLQSRTNVGYPYIMFTDTVNNNTVDVYKDKNLRIIHSNLCCVIGSERVVTDMGLLTAKELYEINEPLTLFDGEKSVKASAMKLISDKEEIKKITLQNGMTHSVTRCHKIQTARGMVRADELKIGDNVEIQINCGLFDGLSIKKEAFLVGLSQSNKVNFDEINEYLQKKLNFEENKVPFWILECNKETQLEYIKGLLIYNKNDKIINGTKDFLRDLQILLANLGISTFVKLNNNNYFLEFTEENGKFSSIIEIEDVDEEPVYCCEVFTDEHKWVCNGIITHNSEIMLPDNEEESFVCCLSSMNDLYFDDWKNTDAVEIMVYFLDAIMSEFIEKGKKIKFMERAVRFAERHRALGIGQLGWHSLLQSKMISFESMRAKYLATEIAKTIKEQSYAASAKMAKEYGEPEIMKGYGRRNSTTTAIAPTKSSAAILGTVSEGIQPNKTNYSIYDLQKGKFTVKNIYLEKLLQEKGLNNDEIWDKILKDGGSVQKLKCLTQEEKDVFKTFAEISPMEVIIQASIRQKFICQSQSLNLMIHPDMPVKEINNLIIEAWKMKIKSLYYQMSISSAQAFSRNLLSCKSCES